jgi:hypothetical protein
LPLLLTVPMVRLLLRKLPWKPLPKEMNFHFKKEKVKNEKGEVIGEGKKLPSIKADVPVPNEAGIITIIQNGGKGLELLMDSVSDVVYNQARNLINAFRDANKDAEVPASVLDLSKLDWGYIASIPKAERGIGVSDEDFDAFCNDYRSVMPAATGKDADRIEKHIGIFKKKFATVRNDKKALGVLKEMLVIWGAHTTNMEDNQEVYDYLNKRVDTLLQEEEKVLAEAL